MVAAHDEAAVVWIADDNLAGQSAVIKKWRFAVAHNASFKFQVKSFKFQFGGGWSSSFSLSPAETG
jgi:hypothetical protein